MMRKLSFCCEGANINMEPETKEKIILEKTELWHKANDASVFPAKRRSVKKMVCNSIAHCICGKCLKTKTKIKTVLPPTPTRGILSTPVLPPQPIYGAGNYGNETEGTLCKWQMK